MSNWFEENPTKAVISYTFVVAGFTWAVSTFVLQDNRINLLRAEADSQKAVAEQYKSKVELLQREVDAIRAENAEYRAWLTQAKDAIPVIVPRIIELKTTISELEKNNETLRASGALAPIANTETTIRRGRAFVEPITSLVVTVLKVNVEGTVQLAVKLPGKSMAEELTVYPGWQWKFISDEKPHTLTLTEVSFATDSVKVQLAEQRK